MHQAGKQNIRHVAPISCSCMTDTECSMHQAPINGKWAMARAIFSAGFLFDAGMGTFHQHSRLVTPRGRRFPLPH
jgi:hypothetical protein